MPRINPVDEIQPYYDGLELGEIRYQHCVECDRAVFYPRTFCPYCMANESALHWRTASGAGTLYTFATIHLPPSQAFAAKIPYTLGYVEMAEGFYLFGEIEGSEESLQIGEAVVAGVDTYQGRKQVRFERA
jgi:uncharacterized OB-fold protein